MNIKSNGIDQLSLSLVLKLRMKGLNFNECLDLEKEKISEIDLFNKVTMSEIFWNIQ
jgi:hypothetical protein